MTAGQQDKAAQRGRKAARRASRSPLAAHRGFAPLLGLWGAALGATLLMVLPVAMIETALHGTLLGTFNGIAQPILAAIAALLLGSVLYGLAIAAHRRARVLAGRPSVAESAVRQVVPINPVRDLGSRRLDDPVDEMPFASPAWRDVDLDAGQAVAADEAAEEQGVDTDIAPDPIELDLAAFAEMPGRNAVWVEEAPAQPQPAEKAEPVTLVHAAPAAPRAVVPPPAPGTAALARLREMPTEALSLPQMVERFAGALHEHRTAPTARALSAADLVAREAALAEALKALAALSGAGAGDKPSADDRHDEPLRDALARFQPPREAGRGAA